MSTALIGLLGVGLGALLATWGTYAMQRRLERGAAYVAAEFIRRELLAAEKLLKAAQKHNVWWAPEDSPQFPSWERHGAALYAGRVPGGRQAFMAARDAIELVNNLSAEVASKARQADTVRADAEAALLEQRKKSPPLSASAPAPSQAPSPAAKLINAIVGAITDIPGGQPNIGVNAPDRSLESGESTRAARERERQAVEEERDAELWRLARVTPDDPNLVAAVTRLEAAQQELPRTPPERSQLAVDRKRQLKRPRGVAVVLGALVALLLTVLLAVSLIQSALPAYTAESVAAAVAQTRGAEFASCDKDDGVDDSWTCQLGDANDAEACELAPEAGHPPRAAVVVADTGNGAVTTECDVSRVTTTREIQQAQQGLLGWVTKQTADNGEVDASPQADPRTSTVEDRRTLLDRLLGSNK